MLVCWGVVQRSGNLLSLQLLQTFWVAQTRQSQHVLRPFVFAELVSVVVLPWCAPLIRISLLWHELFVTYNLIDFACKWFWKTSFWACSTMLSSRNYSATCLTKYIKGSAWRFGSFARSTVTSPSMMSAALSNLTGRTSRFRWDTQTRLPLCCCTKQIYQHYTGKRGGSDCVEAMERNAYILWLQQPHSQDLCQQTQAVWSYTCKLWLAKATAHRSSAISCEIHIEGQ